MKKTYLIPVRWTVEATMEVVADSLDEAIKNAENGAMSTPEIAIGDSFRVYRKNIPFLNDELTDKELASFIKTR